MDLARATAQTPHTSLFRRRLEHLAAGWPLDDWLVEELNRRGHWGAYTTADVVGAPTPGVTLEALIVALAMPNAEADGRNWKVIVRALQRGPFDGPQLALGPIDLVCSKLARADDLDLEDIRWVVAHERLEPARVLLAARTATVPEVHREVWSQALPRLASALAR